MTVLLANAAPACPAAALGDEQVDAAENEQREKQRDQGAEDRPGGRTR